MWRHGVTGVRCHDAGVIMSCGKMAPANEADRRRSKSNVFETLSASANSGVSNLVCCGQAWPDHPHFWPIGWLGRGLVTPTFDQSQQINITLSRISRNIRYLDTSAFGIRLFVFISIDFHQKNGVLENRVSSPLSNWIDRKRIIYYIVCSSTRKTWNCIGMGDIAILKNSFLVLDQTIALL